jgi:hypothetical protein
MYQAMRCILIYTGVGGISWYVPSYTVYPGFTRYPIPCTRDIPRHAARALYQALDISGAIRFAPCTRPVSPYTARCRRRDPRPGPAAHAK